MRHFFHALFLLMRHFFRALSLYWHSDLTWRATRDATRPPSPFCLVKRDGFIYIEPRGSR